MSRNVNLALLALVIALGLFAYYKPQKTDPEHKLAMLKAGDAKNIRIDVAGTAPVVLERTASDWQLTAPI